MPFLADQKYANKIKFNMLSSSTPKIVIERSLVTPEPFKVKSKSYSYSTWEKRVIVSS